LRDSFPWASTAAESDFFNSQTTRGPITLPKRRPRKRVRCGCRNLSYTIVAVDLNPTAAEETANQIKQMVSAALQYAHQASLRVNVELVWVQPLRSRRRPNSNCHGHCGSGRACRTRDRSGRPDCRAK
jgi:hypothetical protein